MSKKTYYALWAIATGVALLLIWLTGMPNLDNPITYLLIGFQLCLLILYCLLRRRSAPRRTP